MGRKSITKSARRKRLLFVVVVVLVLIIGGAIIWSQTGSKKTPLVTTSTTKTATPTSTPVNNPGASSGAHLPADNAVPASPTTHLTEPTGQAYNTSTVSLAANPSMESTCQSLVGASCEIDFSNGSATFFVGPQTVTSNISGVIFDWTPKAVGLTPGSWSVTIVAKLGDQTSSSSSYPFVVNP